MTLVRYFKPTIKRQRHLYFFQAAPFRGYAHASSSIEVANKEVKYIILESSEIMSEHDGLDSWAMKRDPCVKFSQRAKVSVAKYASECGVAAAL